MLSAYLPEALPWRGVARDTRDISKIVEICRDAAHDAMESDRSDSNGVRPCLSKKVVPSVLSD